MINGIGDGPLGRIGATRPAVERTGASARTADGESRPQAQGAASTASEMAALGAPIDTAKVQAIKAAIAEGRYPIDAQKLADRMVALGFDPRR